MTRADLHIHTYYSDGVNSPAEVAAEAKKNGVDVIAVTDHDCMPAYGEISSACKKYGITAVKGIEVSAYVGDVKIHTLGYNFDENNRAFADFTKKLYDGSVRRAEDIIYKLNKNGIKISLDEVANRRKCGLSPFHVMHIAFTCAEKGYCNKNPFNFFNNYLAYGKCGYSCIERPAPQETVEIIGYCGGFSSLAHPGRIDMPPRELLKLISEMSLCGLGGIEAVYSTHTVTETAYYKEIAGNFNLLVTGGSDTHKIGGSRVIGTPAFAVDKILAEKLGIEKYD